ncbi:hypothetical protein ABPG73_011173 [Tetrahymena malaccensis]
MGCTNSQDKLVNGEQPQKKNTKDNSAVHIDTIDKFNVTSSSLVQEKYGKISKDYQLLNPPLGKGAFGEVRKCVHKATNLTRAVKIISKAQTPKAEQDRLKQEVEILKQLDHPNIIKIYEFYQDQKYFYIVTELCTGGELFDKIIEERSFDERKTAETMRQILHAVNYCHKNNIVHRDLKPENILYESNKPGALLKVVDFGTSIAYDPNVKMNQKLGTPYYIAPEVLSKKYDEKCDIWSCGVILYILLCGSPPFNGDNDEQIMNRVKIGKFSFDSEDWAGISDGAKSLITKMLEKDPVKRLSAQDVLNDPWLKQASGIDVVDKPTLKRALNNMQTFRAGKKLQEATWMYLVNYLASKEEKNELLKVFQSLDTNNDGKLQRDELIQGYKKIFNHPNPQEEVDKILTVVDKNQSGEIDYSEWVAATINRENLLSKQRLELAFKMFDQDGSGTVTKDELKQMFQGMGNVDDKVWKQLLNEVDDNGDGQISYKEFKEMMLKLIDPNASGSS